MGRIRLEGYLEVPSDRMAAVAAALPEHIALTQAEPGCLHFSVTPSPDAPDHLLVSELFIDQAAFEQHQARAAASPWAEITRGLARHYTVTDADLAEASPRFAVPDVLRRRATAEGEPGLAWLANLAATLAGLEQDWGITIGPALPGGTAAFVAEATNDAGETSIIKLATPGSAAGRHEAAVLAEADGHGYARLLRHAATRGAMLLERLGDRLDTLELPYERQVDVLCATLLKAWRPVPADFPGLTGAQKANDLAHAIVRLWEATGQPCAQAVIDTALMYCRERAITWRPQNAILAHGDPHPANILAVPETNPTQFKFIDPDGLAIEPAYDLGVVLRAWHDGIAGRHAHDIARAHARYLTTRTQVPTEAIWQWGYIERVSTGLHLLEIGETEAGQAYLTVADAIASTAG